MPISFRRSVPALLICLFSLPAIQAIGQDASPEATPVTALQKQLDRIDFAVSAAGSLGTTVSGYEQRDINTSHSLLKIKPSTSVGELITLRYTAKPYVGFEFNFGNARTTQNYTFSPQPSQSLLFNNAQTGVRELTLGYVAHLPFHPLGITPYAGAGGGTIRFKPTTGGGQGLPQQYRAVYYYNVGLEDNFPGSHFGARVGFRQLVYLAPDFLQNYLTITRRVSNYEPTIGFYVRF
jgi:opacity protein-like surface antigen